MIILLVNYIFNNSKVKKNESENFENTNMDGTEEFTPPPPKKKKKKTESKTKPNQKQTYPYQYLLQHQSNEQFKRSKN